MQSVSRHHVEARKLSADTTPEPGTIGKRQARVIIEPCIVPVLKGYWRFPAQIMLAATPCCLPDPFSLTLVMKYLELSTRLSRITIRVVTRVQAYFVTTLVNLAHQRANPRMPQLIALVVSHGVCGDEIESAASPMTLIPGHERGKIVAGVSCSVPQLHQAPAPDPPERAGEVATADEIAGAALQHPQRSHERMLERPVDVMTEQHPEAVLPPAQLGPERPQALPQDFNVLVDNRTIEE